MKTSFLILILASTFGMFGCSSYQASKMFCEGPVTKVNLAGWQKLEVGMTKEQVISLLGNPPSGTGPVTMTLSGTTIHTLEFWEYNWSSGITLIPHPHPNSYHVYFDQHGKLSSWGAPNTTGKQNK